MRTTNTIISVIAAFFVGCVSGYGWRCKQSREQATPQSSPSNYSYQLDQLDEQLQQLEQSINGPTGK